MIDPLARGILRVVEPGGAAPVGPRGVELAQVEVRHAAQQVGFGQAALDEALAGTTTFLIAQRVSSVLTADQILVLDHGQIAARGTHAALLERSPIYQEIYRSQMGDGEGVVA